MTGFVWGAVDKGSDQGSGAREFEYKVFEGMSSRNGNGGCFNVLSVNCSNTPSPPLRTRLVSVGKSRGCGLIE